GSLLPQETGQVFNSPSAWATHCKRLVNPAKKSGCGWASVRYKGQKLDQYKAAWLRRHQPNVPPPEEVPPCSPHPRQPQGGPAEPAGAGKGTREGDTGSGSVPGGRRRGCGDGTLCFPDPGAPGKRLEIKPRVPVRYCTLGTRDSARYGTRGHGDTGVARAGGSGNRSRGGGGDPAVGLGGVTHPCAPHPSPVLTVLRAFPCRTRLGDAEAAGAVEEEPHPVPTGPYFHGNPGVESRIAPFWVMPPPEQRPNDYGIPMDVEVTYIQDGFLTNDVVQEMVSVAWGLPKIPEPSSTCTTRPCPPGAGDSPFSTLAGSLASRTPKDQSFTHVLEQIYSLLKLSG
ncbi:MPND protein, partial [Pachyramphus minor]|nr:MPND protein [Pachyramphus minor]